MTKEPIHIAMASNRRYLRQCHDNQDILHEVGEKGRQFVEDHFSVANFKKSVDAFLDGNMTDVL